MADTHTPREPVWLTRAEAARRLRVHPDTIDKWTREGRLARYLLPSGQPRFRTDDVDALAQPNDRPEEK
jgi:excisionase family DNA binding protein